MNFSTKVKEELTQKGSSARHCRMAELSAILLFCGYIFDDEEDNEKNTGDYSLVVRTHTKWVAARYRDLLYRVFHMDASAMLRSASKKRNTYIYTVGIRDREVADRIIDVLGLVTDKKGRLERSPSHDDVIRRECCKRAFLKGSFLAAGSISDPQKDYHIEIKCADEDTADLVAELFTRFGVSAKKSAKKSSYIVYIKDGDAIVDALNVMEAPVSLMETENTRILKDMSNYYNRQVNCESANIKKSVTTAHRQIEDIRYVMDHKGVDFLPVKLQNIAIVRLEHPDVSLEELGSMLDPPLSKSGASHRLSRISRMAEDLRDELEERG